MKLTDRFIRNVSCPAGSIEKVYWDDRRRGLGLRVHAQGTKTFIIHYRYKGKQYKISLGHPPEMSVRQAHSRYSEFMLNLDRGKNPKEEVVANEISMGDLVYTYLDRHARMLKSGPAQKWALEKWVVPRWGEWPASSIRRLDVDELHKEIGRTSPVMANRLVSLLHVIFSFAKKWGVLKTSEENPATFIERFPEKKRTVWVVPEDMDKLIRALEPENVLIRAAILLYLTTGLRNRELVRRRWEDIDWERKILILTETKSKRPFLLPLSDAALEILKGIPRFLGNPYIFPSNKKGRPWTQFPRNALLRIRSRIGMNITVHDLRRTYGSWLASSGISLKIIAGLLNQTSQSITDSVYSQLANDPLREAASIVGEKIRQIAEGEHKKNNTIGNEE
ncbi:MAG: tyrosine-type recombinase/integrase [bacterium]